MANTNKTTKTAKQTDVETEIDSKVETNTDNENVILKQTIADMTKQMQEMQAMMISMQSKQSFSNTITNANNKVSIGCRFLNGVTVYSPNREIEIFIPYGENNIIDFTENEMSMLLKQKFFREFLAEDVLYFINEEDYARYSIKKIMSLDDDSIIDILDGKENLKSVFDKYTNSKRNDPVSHVLFYTIVNLVDKNKISRLGIGVQREIEDYFNFKIDDARERLMFLDMVKST